MRVKDRLDSYAARGSIGLCLRGMLRVKGGQRWRLRDGTCGAMQERLGFSDARPKAARQSRGAPPPPPPPSPRPARVCTSRLRPDTHTHIHTHTHTHTGNQTSAQPPGRCSTRRFRLWPHPDLAVSDAYTYTYTYTYVHTE